MCRIAISLKCHKPEMDTSGAIFILSQRYHETKKITGANALAIRHPSAFCIERQ